MFIEKSRKNPCFYSWPRGCTWPWLPTSGETNGLFKTTLTTLTAMQLQQPLISERKDRFSDVYAIVDSNTPFPIPSPPPTSPHVLPWNSTFRETISVLILQGGYVIHSEIRLFCCSRWQMCSTLKGSPSSPEEVVRVHVCTIYDVWFMNCTVSMVFRILKLILTTWKKDLFFCYI